MDSRTCTDLRGRAHIVKRTHGHDMHMDSRTCVVDTHGHEYILDSRTCIKPARTWTRAKMPASWTRGHIADILDSRTHRGHADILDSRTCTKPTRTSCVHHGHEYSLDSRTCSKTARKWTRGHILDMRTSWTRGHILDMWTCILDMSRNHFGK